MRDFRTLKVWRRSHEATLRIYRVTRTFPRSEEFGLTAQLRRAAASVGANLAESCGRGSDGDSGRFVQIALGSACEVLNHVLLACDLGIMAEADFLAAEEDLDAVRRMLINYLRTLRG